MIRTHTSTQRLGSLALLAGVILTVHTTLLAADSPPAKYHSAFDVAYNAGGNLLAVSDRTGGAVTILAAPGGQIAHQVELHGSPSGLAWSADGKSLFVAECDAGTVAEIDPASGKVLRRLPTGPRPIGLTLAAKKGLLVVTDSANDRVAVFDLATGQPKAQVPVVREPYFLAVTPDESRAIVGNLLPLGDASLPTQSAIVSLIDLETLAPAGEIKLPAGSTNVRKIVVSPEGRWAYVAHTLARYTLPTTQLERGWMSTNAVTVLDVAEKKVYCTLLLDLITEGAAEPWGAAMTHDGSSLFVSIAGCHQIARLDLAKLHQLLRSDEYLAAAKPATGAVADPLNDADKAKAKATEETAQKKSQAEVEQYRRSGVQNLWLEIRLDAAKRELLINDLAALHTAEILSRTTLPGVFGPRGIAVSPDDKQLAVAAYFSGAVLFVNLPPPPAPPAEAAASSADNKSKPAAPATSTAFTSPVASVPPPPPFQIAGIVALGKQPEPDAARAGEMVFHDGTICFQHWLSCAVCHPEARTDGLNWDLLNDGIGNPKNSRNLLGADKRAPMMSHGVRATFGMAVEAGFKHILFRQPSQGETATVEAYLASLKPTPSPRLVNGGLSPKAQRGKQIFESEAAGCARCHSGPQLTDQKIYDVGTKRNFDTSSKFVAPSLVELWRSAPYLHDGSAATIMDLLATCKTDKHGSTSRLSKEELESLAEYLLSL